MRKPNLDEVATLLEKAADLYESETIQWCSGTWVSGRGVNVSACAEGSLLLAAGMKPHDVFGNVSRAFYLAPVARDAVRALMATLRRQGHNTSSVNHWNDNLIGNRQEVTYGFGPKQRVVLGAADKTVAKAEVIELMKQTAKDLRNQSEVSLV